MGEMADYMINGDDCEQCGMHIGEGSGYPRTCAECNPDDQDAPPLYDFEKNTGGYEKIKKPKTVGQRIKPLPWVKDMLDNFGGI